ncbi:histidine kinase [Xanthobacter autotrophicus]|nr:histidine kinase [Xanthobacter autotrophicus]MDI4664969.1 histidine kinase [Xanthobacter autotrophicus]
MPTLFRLLAVLAVLCGLGYAALWALATKVEPQEREITFTVPAEKIGK